MFVSDNCCSDRPFLQGIFGEHVKVKLDLFHAISRIIREIPKKKMPRKSTMMFAEQLRLCFRTCGDTASKRQQPTAPLKDITKKLKDLKTQWESTLPPKAVKEITNLQKLHAQNGCLRYVMLSKQVHSSSKYYKLFQ